MKRILTYLKGYKKECILAPFFKMLEVCFELLVPLVMADIIDNGIKYASASGNSSYTQQQNESVRGARHEEIERL